MPVSVNFQATVAAKIRERVESVLPIALQLLGEQMWIEVTERMRQGLDYKGDPQRPNAPSTIAAKMRRGAGATPLVDTGHLSDINNWTISVEDKNQLRISYSKPEILDYLEQKDYVIPSIPSTCQGKEVGEWVSDKIKELLA